VLKSTVPSSHEAPLTVDLTNSEPIFDTSVIFWSSEAFVDERVAFQLSLTAPSDIVISALPFSSLEIYFSHKEEPLMVYHKTDAASTGKVERVDLGDLSLENISESEAYLRWEKGSTIVFVGTVSSDVPLALTVWFASLTDFTHLTL